MKKTAWLLLVFGLPVVSAPVWGRTVETSIQRVVAYEDRAMVERAGKAEVKAGSSELVIGGLPPMLVDDSVRVKGEAAGKVTITGTEVRQSYLADPRRKEVEALEKKIDGLKEERKALDDRLEALALQRKFVASIQSSTSEKISKEMLLTKPAPGEWGKVLDFIGSRTLQLSGEERKVQVEKKELNKKIEAREKELAQIKSYSTREAKEIVVTVEADRASSLDLELSYVVWGATWRPVYDARADQNEGIVGLTYRAEVRQKTGEEWSDVSLALSTARPSIGGRPGELAPWYIDIRKPPPRTKAFRPSSGLWEMKGGDIAAVPMMGAGKYDLEEEKAVELVYDEARLEKSGAAVTFEIPRKQEIPSDGNFHGVAIATRDVKAEFEYIAIPKIVEFPYLAAKFKNEEEYPLLAGKINLFLGSDFVGTSRLDTVAPGQESEIYLGVDEDLKVKRELISEEAEKGGLFRGKTGYKNFRYRITVENFRKQTAKITVFDQVPVSKSPEIKVELDETVPEPVVIEDKEKPGVLSWELTLKPGEKKTIEFEFTVEYPKDKEISGL